jgi:Amt family ammonium transporter
MHPKPLFWCRFAAAALLLLGAFSSLAQSAEPLAPRAEPAALAPTVEQRLAAIEAYLANGDPTVALRDGHGAVPAGLTTRAESVPGPAHNTWMMVSAALVILMTLPGLGLFYGGLVRTKNVLSVIAWCFGITSWVTVLWWAVGYSLVFGKNFGSGVLGGSEFFFFRGVGSAANPDYSFWVSHNVFAMFQLAFAIITPAVLIGAVVERMKFAAVMAFSTLWLLLVYCPLAHMVWGVNGAMNGLVNAKASIQAVDFAGGMVVEMASGYSALVLCLFVGRRSGYGKTPMPPHSLVACVTGTGLLWFGWYGFNAGSAVAADAIAANAFTTTTLAARSGGRRVGTFGISRAAQGQRARLLLGCRGGTGDHHAGLRVCGCERRDGVRSAGRRGAVLCLHQDQSLVKVRRRARRVWRARRGGTVGLILTGFLALPAANPNLANNLKLVVGHTLWMEQAKGIAVTLLLAAGGTAVIAWIVDRVMGLRATVETETEGLDVNEHGEEAYIFDAKS